MKLIYDARAYDEESHNGAKHGATRSPPAKRKRRDGSLAKAGKVKEGTARTPATKKVKQPSSSEPPPQAFHPSHGQDPTDDFFTGKTTYSTPNGNCCPGSIAVALALVENEGTMMIRDRALQLLASSPKLPWLTRRMIADAKERVYSGGKPPTAEKTRGRREWGQNGLAALASSPTTRHYDDVLLGITADDLVRKLVVREVQPKKEGHELDPDEVVIRLFAPSSQQVVDSPAGVSQEWELLDHRKLIEGLVLPDEHNFNLMQLREKEMKTIEGGVESESEAPER